MITKQTGKMKMKLQSRKYTNLGTWIKTSREKLGYSQCDFAKSLKLTSSQSISNIERGITPVPLKYVKSLAQTLRVPQTVLVNRMVAQYRQKLLIGAKIRTKSAA